MHLPNTAASIQTLSCRPHHSSFKLTPHSQIMIHQFQQPISLSLPLNNKKQSPTVVERHFNCHSLWLMAFTKHSYYVQQHQQQQFLLLYFPPRTAMLPLSLRLPIQINRKKSELWNRLDGWTCSRRRMNMINFISRFLILILDRKMCDLSNHLYLISGVWFD